MSPSPTTRPKQVEFVSGADVPAHTFFVYDASTPFYGYGSPITDQYYGQSGITDVQNWLEFSTGEDKGLGADLPADASVCIRKIPTARPCSSVKTVSTTRPKARM